MLYDGTQAIADALISFHIDGYPVTLGAKLESAQIKNISYWYSMWSHRRDGLWKGVVPVNLDPAFCR